MCYFNQYFFRLFPLVGPPVGLQYRITAQSYSRGLYKVTAHKPIAVHTQVCASLVITTLVNPRKQAYL